MKEKALRIASVLLILAAMVLTMSDRASASGCCIEERSYYPDADSCDTGPGAIGIWHYGCSGQVIESWGVQTDHYYSYIWCGCICYSYSCGAPDCLDDYELGAFVGCNMEANE